MAGLLAFPGVSVQSLAGVGCGCPDIAVGFAGKNYLFEIKDPDKAPSDRALTDAEKKFHRFWRGQIAVVETVDDAIRILGIKA